MRFSKWQGCGNDFVLVDCFKENVSDFAAFAKKVCDRHYGIGGDGVLYVLPSSRRIFACASSIRTAVRRRCAATASAASRAISTTSA